MEIYIPTRGRVFQETFASLPKEIGERVIFVQNHSNYVGPNLDLGLRRVITPDGIHGIGSTRQWIIENATDKKVLMLDDDLVFATRRTDDPTKFREATSGELNTLLGSIDALLDDYVHVGVATREGGNRDTNPYCHNTRLLRILAYRTDVLRNEGIRFDRLELMEDFHVTLSLLSRGYPNVKINWIVHNQRSSNAPGGCSIYRTLEKQREAALGLKADFPDFVSVVEKTTKTAWQGKTRTDVVVQWKKAFDASRKTVVLKSSLPDLGLKESVLSLQEPSTKDTPDSAE